MSSRKQDCTLISVLIHISQVKPDLTLLREFHASEVFARDRLTIDGKHSLLNLLIVKEVFLHFFITS